MTQLRGRPYRVGVIGPTGPDDFADNILSGLAQMGQIPVSLGAAVPEAGRTMTGIYRTTFTAAPTVLRKWQERIVRNARRADLDAIVSIDARLQPTTVGLLRAIAPIALWFPDHVAHLGAQVMLAASYSCLFFKDPFLVRRLNALTDLPVRYLPEACNPAWHRPGPRLPFNPTILVAGNLYPSRVRLLEKLHHAGIPLELHSSWWARSLTGFDVQRLPVLPQVHRDGKAIAFRQAAAILNNLNPAEEGMNCRLFEAAGCGAVVLCEDRPVLGELFDRDKDLLVFTNFDELIDQARWALANPEDATTIGDAAAVRAHSDHTYQHRLADIFGVLGLTYAEPESTALHIAPTK